MCSADPDEFSIDNLPETQGFVGNAEEKEIRIKPFLNIEEEFQRLDLSSELASTDARSEGCSSDSGKGTSEIVTPADSINDPDSTAAAPWHECAAYNAMTAYSETMGTIMPCHAMIYEFEIPQSIVGRLIGKYGSYVNLIKETTGANIIVKRHHNNSIMKICAVEGLCGEIEAAIRMIRERFPMKRYPFLRLEQLNHQRRIPSTAISFLPPNNKLHLVEGVVNDVIISCVVGVDHVFVIQPLHPTYPSLSRLHKALMSFYEQAVAAPKLVRPFNVGVICVACMEDRWFRAEVVSMHEDRDEATVRLVDGGGYMVLPIDGLRQIRFDFVTIPFQGTECRLAGVKPLEGQNELGEAAQQYFHNLTTGQILQANVAGYTANETLIYLYRMGEDQVPIFVNQELIEKGLAAVDNTYTFTTIPETESAEEGENGNSFRADDTSVVGI